MRTRNGRTSGPETTRWRRGGIATIVVGATVVVLGACSGASGDSGDGDERVVLKFAWWGDGARADRYEQAIDLFEDEHPNVTVQTSFAGLADYWKTRTDQASTDTLPDVFQMDDTRLREFGSSGVIAPLDEFTDSGEIDVSTFPTTVLPATKVDDHIFGIPTAAGGLARFVNTTLLDDLGVKLPQGDLTWDQYDALLSKIASAGKDHEPAVGGSTPYTQDWSVFEVWLTQHGKSLFADGGFGFTQDDLASWWGRAAPLLEDDGFVTPKSTDKVQAQDFLGGGLTGSEISSYNFLGRFARGSAGGDFAMSLPPTADPDERGLSIQPSLELSMAASTEHPDEAAELIDFLVNDPEASKAFGFSRGVPISQTALDALEPTGVDKDVVQYWEDLRKVVGDSPAPPPKGSGAAAARFTRLAQDVAAGDMSVDDGAAEFFRTAPGMLG